jgi:hypothetical protein
MLDSGVILEAILGEIFTVSRTLETTMRHLRDHWDVSVDPDDTEIERL